MPGSADVEMRQATISDAMKASWIAMRPEGICSCRDGHPVLLLRETGGSRSVTVRIDEDEARRLAGELDGVRGRLSRTYETFEEVVKGLGADIKILWLIGGTDGELSGEIEVVSEGRQVRVRAHPGDVVALAARLLLTVRVPVEVARSVLEGLEEWHPRPASPGVLETMQTSPRRFEPPPEDYDW